jgi:cytochrome c-type biogenesis protein CcmE
MRPAAWVGLVVIVAALAFGSRAFVANLTPYITFEQAREAKGQVQIVGKLVKGSTAYKNKTLLFQMVDDKNDRMPVAYDDVRPPNFEMATQITAIGAYDGDTFRAEKLLVKCPSKYQGEDGKGREYDGNAAAAASGDPAGRPGPYSVLSGKKAPQP